MARPRRTKGGDDEDYGIRQYGQPTETGTQLKLFKTLLSYAMLFGLEEGWAQQFEHLFQQQHLRRHQAAGAHPGPAGLAAAASPVAVVVAVGSLDSTATIQAVIKGNRSE